MPAACADHRNSFPLFVVDEGAAGAVEQRYDAGQHNVRVVAKYYRQISVARLANLLGLSEDEAERHVSHMVSSNGLYCKIDRPAGIAQFHKPKPPDEVLQDWAGDISKMLNLVEMTCHLINKESMLHKDVLGL